MANRARNNLAIASAVSASGATGGTGRSTMITGKDNRRAASSLALVAMPPLFLLTRKSILRLSRKFTSSSRENGGRPNKCVQLSGNSTPGGSMERDVQVTSVRSMNAETSLRPMVRKARAFSGTAFAADASIWNGYPVVALLFNPWGTQKPKNTQLLPFRMR